MVTYLATELIQPFLSFSSEHPSAIVSSLAFIVALYSLWSNIRVNRYNRLHSVYTMINDLEIEMSTVSEDEKRRARQLLRQILNQTEYLAFLVNKGRIKHKHAYNVAEEHIDDIIEKGEYMGMSYPTKYPEMYKLDKRWSERPTRRKKIIWNIIDIFDSEDEEIDVSSLPEETNEQPMDQIKQHYREKIRCKICQEDFDPNSKREVTGHLTGGHSLKGKGISNTCTRKVWKKKVK
jgi:hypothetical protein